MEGCSDTLKNLRDFLQRVWRYYWNAIKLVAISVDRSNDYRNWHA